MIKYEISTGKLLRSSTSPAQKWLTRSLLLSVRGLIERKKVLAFFEI